jgi:hypothetical protein
VLGLHTKDCIHEYTLIAIRESGKFLSVAEATGRGVFRNGRCRPLFRPGTARQDSGSAQSSARVRGHPHLRLNEAPLHGSSHGSANLRIGRGEGGHARRRRPPGSGHLHFLTLSKSRGRRYGLLRHRLRQKPEPPDSREMSVAGFPSVGRTSGAGFRASEVGGEEMTGGKSFPASACILSLWL